MFHKHMAQMIINTTGKRYEKIMYIIRCTLLFLFLWSRTMCSRGSRSLQKFKLVADSPSRKNSKLKKFLFNHFIFIWFICKYALICNNTFHCRSLIREINKELKNLCSRSYLLYISQNYIRPRLQNHEGIHLIKFHVKISFLPWVAYHDSNKEIPETEANENSDKNLSKAKFTVSHDDDDNDDDDGDNFLSEFKNVRSEHPNKIFFVYLILVVYQKEIWIS